MKLRKFAYILSGSLMVSIGFVSTCIIMFTMMNVSDWYNGIPLLIGSFAFILIGGWLTTKYIKLE